MLTLVATLITAHCVHLVYWPGHHVWMPQHATADYLRPTYQLQITVSIMFSGIAGHNTAVYLFHL